MRGGRWGVARREVGTVRRNVPVRSPRGLEDVHKANLIGQQSVRIKDRRVSAQVGPGENRQRWTTLSQALHAGH